MPRLLSFPILALAVGFASNADAAGRAFGTTLAPAAPIERVGVFYEDDRVYVPKYAGSPYGPVGTLRKPSNRRTGSAFLVGPCHILSNWHAVFQAARPPSDRFVLRFFVGVGVSHETGPPARGTRAMPVVWGDFQETPDDGLNYAEDWALLELEECLGERYGWLSLVPLRVRSARRLRDRLSLAGLPKDRDERAVSVDPRCAIRERMDGSIEPFEGMWAHDCAARAGNSGSPILFRDADGTLRVIALHVGSARGADSVEQTIEDAIVPRFGGKNYNVAVPVARFLRRIRRYLGTMPDSGRKDALEPAQ